MSGVSSLVLDALALKELPEVFHNVIDSGLLHLFDDEDRRRYVEGLASALKPGGRQFSWWGARRFPSVAQRHPRQPS